MKHTITIEIDTPEDVSLFGAVKGFADELGRFYNTSARFDINSNVGKEANIGMTGEEGWAQVQSGLSTSAERTRFGY